MKLSSIMVVLIAVLGISNAAMAQGEGRHGHRHGEFTLEKEFSFEKLKNLDLSKEQKEKLKELRQSRKEESQKLRAELKEAKKTFRDVLRSNASKDEVIKAYEAMIDKKRLVGKARMTGLLEAREILTPEQRAKLFDHKD